MSFDYKNEWLGFFDKVIITRRCGSVQEHGWKINAGQYITTKYVMKMKTNLIWTAVTAIFAIEFDANNWSEVQEMQQYRGKKQEYILETTWAIQK